MEGKKKKFDSMKKVGKKILLDLLPYYFVFCYLIQTIRTNLFTKIEYKAV